MATQQERLAKEEVDRGEQERQRKIEEFARTQLHLAGEADSAGSKRRRLDEAETVEPQHRKLKVSGAVAGSGDTPILPSFWLVGPSVATLEACILRGLPYRSPITAVIDTGSEA